MGHIKYVDIEKSEMSKDINLLFTDWKGKSERVCVFSPHDDDAVIGAGYGILSAIQNGAEVFIFIFCSGNAGYSKAEERTAIVDIRRRETVECYKKLGIKEENIIRFDYSDFSSLQYVTWEMQNGKEGCFKRVITKLREIKATRLLIPNGYKEHIDHRAVNLIGIYFTPQVGDQIVVDWAEPYKINSVLEYSVWADLSPEDSFLSGRDSNLRANKMIIVDERTEKEVCNAVSAYCSQDKIIESLICARGERKTGSGDFIEVYLLIDARPKLDYSPYIQFVDKIKNIE